MPRGDALAGAQFGILAGHEDFAGQTFFAERLDRAAGGAVVRGEDGVEVRSDRGDRCIGDLLGVLRFPVLRPILVHHFELALFDQRLEDVVLTLLEEDRVVIGLGAVDANDLLHPAFAAGDRPDIGPVTLRPSRCRR